MAATRVQHGTNSTSSGTSLAVTLTGVTAGNSIVVLVGQQSTTLQTFSATDDVDAGSYTVHGHNYAASNRATAILSFANCTGGDTQITVTCGSASMFAITAVEVAGAGTSPAITYDENDTVSGNPKYATQATGFSPPDGSLVLAVFQFNADTTAITVGSGYTGMYNNATPTTQPAGLTEYRQFATGATNHQPDCSTTTTTRVGPAAAVYIEEAAAAAFQPAWAHRATQVAGVI